VDIWWMKEVFGEQLLCYFVWEIMLGAYSHFAAEESLVNLDLEEGVTVNVIGDVHGVY